MGNTTQRERTIEILIGHFRSLGQANRWKSKQFDEDRLERIEKFLKPNKCYIGREGFEGYVVYRFGWNQKVILECPIYGNAIYIIKDDWENISKLSKPEVKYLHSDKVVTINHTETWFDRLKSELQSLY